MIKISDIKICVIGLGYVGLPLARLFSTKYPTVGYDIDSRRVEALMQGHDDTLEVEDDLLQETLCKHGFCCTASMILRTATSTSSPCPRLWTTITVPTSPPCWALPRL